MVKRWVLEELTVQLWEEPEPVGVAVAFVAAVVAAVSVMVVAFVVG